MTAEQDGNRWRAAITTSQAMPEPPWRSRHQLHATVAGVPEDGVEVTFEGGMLSIAVKAAPFDVQGKLIRQERPWGNWSRKLELPMEVDSANIATQFDNGVLTVRVPKAAKAKPVRIPIGAAHKLIEG